ncbi:hypothetical protein [Marinomonas mediterranea]|uniref:Uncharacterized protein n=1 Tax=Marinomonas mediterranea (strain ATCC 700492 / JCM 21426 / NBRC 103028 / MMB-1) TaxID=717774 RepID=F2JYA0_MARM1|nr:hypothetical protein [Marinomonas mediterranea]ADZ91931.1 hypothetical protein Marme_2700 [Marinomonas mediterranea MMB-1]WCN09883.1 glycerol-3-phosphate dehydrogenase [Marinomonas mediterranea]WCN13964.1 glycerol-3-phosphate dehydrogenase [Marinomonas mediterranea]WCN18015.1 glycerol-3-phosphate dehydrogenase [Marinomonas mediterranea MMB-1]
MAFPTAVNSQITDSVSQIPTYEGATAELFGDLIKLLSVASQKGISTSHQACILVTAAAMSGVELEIPALDQSTETA